MALVVALAVVALLVAVALHREPAGLPRSSGTATPVGGSPTAPAGSTPPSVEPTATPSTPGSTAPGRDLSGRKLATAWLEGYLDRSSRDDERWVDAIRDITDPDLLAQLQTNGPDAVGLFELRSWRVMDVKPYDDPDQPVDTASRQVLAYSAAVTDGKKTERKPFLLYCYRSADDRWTVSMVEQPYTSES